MRLPTALSALAALLLAAGLSGVTAAPALAHARLIASEPAASATLDQAPEVVVLEFNEPVEAEFGQLQVSGPDGTRLDQQAPTSNGTFVEAPVGPPTAAGTHTVAYRVIAADGHPVEGSFTYEVPESVVAAGEPEPEPTPEATAEPTPEPTATTPAPSATSSTPEPIDAEETSAEGEDAGLPVVPLLVGALLVVGVGGALIARRGDDAGGA